MADSLFDRFKRSVNIFTNRNPTTTNYYSGTSYSYSPSRPRLSGGNEKSIVSSIITRIAIDVSSVNVIHVKTDENGRYLETEKSLLNDRLTYSANMDQTGRAFIQDIVLTLLDEGCVAIVPVDWDSEGDELYINSMRTGRIDQWFTDRVRVNVYDQGSGNRKDVIVKKKECCIVENPLYAVLNETNSTLQRLIRKLNILDYIDEQTGSGKLDLIIQLPYSLKGDKRNALADDRIKKIESQLYNHKYGIAYIDAAEHITQLNRPVDNNLMTQIEYLTTMLYSQLGLSTGVFDGTADEKQMLNYYNRTIEPILGAIVDEMNRKFISYNARENGERVMYFRDPFRLVPVEQMAEIADKFTRNCVMTANEIRQVIGMKLSSDPNADVLKNANVSQSPDAKVIDVNGNVISEGTNNTEVAEKVNQFEDQSTDRL